MPKPTTEKSYYIAELQKFSDRSVDEQRARRVDIVDLFDGLWERHPSRHEFASAMAGIVLFPEMLWRMVNDPVES